MPSVASLPSGPLSLSPPRMITWKAVGRERGSVLLHPAQAAFSLCFAGSGNSLPANTCNTRAGGGVMGVMLQIKLYYVHIGGRSKDALEQPRACLHGHFVLPRHLIISISTNFYWQLGSRERGKGRQVLATVATTERYLRSTHLYEEQKSTDDGDGHPGGDHRSDCLE
jgi:hypothetical protein